MVSKFKTDTTFYNYTSKLQKEILVELIENGQAFLGVKDSARFKVVKTLQKHNPETFQVIEQKEHVYGKNLFYYYLKLNNPFQKD